MDKEKEKTIKLKLKQWGSGSLWLKERHKEYGSYISLYEKGEEDCMVSDEALFDYKADAEKVFRDVREYMSQKSVMDEAVSRLDPMERAIIVFRYAKNVKWDALPAHLPVKISVRQCHRLHKESLEKLAEILNGGVAERSDD